MADHADTGVATPRDRVRELIEGPRFRTGILAVIFFNAIILGLETSETVTGAAGGLLSLLDEICLAIFVVEIVLKFYAYRLGFFRDAWNLFDFVIVGIALMPATDGLSVLRALRALRVLRAISMAPTLRRVVQGLVNALPGMASVFLLMMIVFYIGSVMATKLFGASHPHWFGTLGESAFSLFQVMTLEGWPDIARGVMEVYPQAWAFFVPFILMTTFAVVNLLVGLVVNSMQQAHGEETDAATDTYRGAVIEKLERIEARLDRIEGRGRAED